MSSRPEKEAIGINALAEFLKGFQSGREKKQALARDEEAFARDLGAKMLEAKKQAAREEFDAYRSLQDDLRSTLMAGARQEVYDPTGKITGSLGAKLSPEAVESQKRDLVEGFKRRYPNSSYVSPIEQDGVVIPPPTGPGPVPPGMGDAIRPPVQIPLPGAFASKPAINTRLTDKDGSGSGSGSQTSEFDKVRERDWAAEVTRIEKSAPNREAERGLMSRVVQKLQTGEYKPGPIQGRIAPLAQPEFQSDIGQLRGVAIAEMGQYFKGAMSDRDVQIMLNSKFDPNLNAPDQLAQNVEILARVSRENDRRAAAARDFNARYGGLRMFVPPALPEDLKQALASFTSNAAKPAAAPAAQQGGVVAKFERGPDGKLRRVQ